MIDSRELFHSTFAGVKSERPPFWIMRQAGRYLPQYRILKEKSGGFLNMVKTPQLSFEAAMQPIERFDFDCAILFSDILVVSEALGFAYDFKDKGGIALKKTISTKEDIENLDTETVCEKLVYVFESLKLLRKELPLKAVLGFSASPFTLGAYMVEGESKEGFPKYMDFIKNNYSSFELLMEKLTQAISKYALSQLLCGIDGFQIFDSHSNLMAKDNYMEMSGKWIAAVLETLQSRTRSIVYARNMTKNFGELASIGADAYSVDDSQSLSSIKQKWEGFYTLQGNLDEKLLESGTPEEVFATTKKIVEDMKPYSRHIFNLARGITPNAKIENVSALCNAIKG